LIVKIYLNDTENTKTHLGKQVTLLTYKMSASILSCSIVHNVVPIVWYWQTRNITIGQYDLKPNKNKYKGMVWGKQNGTVYERQGYIYI
jgi:hypothetical protein